MASMIAAGMTLEHRVQWKYGCHHYIDVLY